MDAWKPIDKTSKFVYVDSGFGGHLVALKDDGSVLYRTGITNETPEGTDWSYLSLPPKFMKDKNSRENFDWGRTIKHSWHPSSVTVCPTGYFWVTLEPTATYNYKGQYRDYNRKQSPSQVRAIRRMYVHYPVDALSGKAPEYAYHTGDPAKTSDRTKNKNQSKSHSFYSSDGAYEKTFHQYQWQSIKNVDKWLKASAKSDRK